MTPKARRLHCWLMGSWLALPAAVLAQEPPHRSAFFIDNLATIPRGAQPAPPGTYVNGVFRVQDTLAEADDFVLYKHMWFRNGIQLGPLGRYQLDLISRRLPTVPFPVVIETSGNDQLDEARRQVIINMMAMRGLSDTSRIIVAFPMAEGMAGDFAQGIFSRYMNMGAGGGGLGSIAGVGGPLGYGGGFPGLFGFGR